MLKSLVFLLIEKALKLVQTPRFEEDKSKILFSWANFLHKNKATNKEAQIYLYTIKGCMVCEEIKLWAEYNWVPLKIVECTPIKPFLIPKMKPWASLRGFKAKNKQTGEKTVLFLNPAFPQVDYVKYNDETKEHGFVLQIGNSKVIREFIEDTMVKNPKDFPGFERGVYGDRTPEDIIAAQMKEAAKNNVR